MNEYDEDTYYEEDGFDDTDHETLIESEKWITKMNLEDKAIERYQFLQDDGYVVPDVYTFVKWYFHTNGYSLEDMCSMDSK